MIDEYQDTNSCQIDFLRLLCEQHGNLAVVGDDDQSIYGWRGAEARNILEFAQQFPGAKVIKLEENYRSTPPILRAANAVIEKNKTRHGKTLWTSREGGEPIDLVAAPDEQAEATFVAETIDYLVAHKRFQLRDIAILYRATKQSEAIEEALRQAHIEYHVIGGTAFFERKEVKDAIAYLRQSLNANVSNTPQRGESYLLLADLYFEAEEFVQAKNYYDSTLTVLQTTDERYGRVTTYSKNLTEIARLITTIAENDSIVRIYNMDEAGRKELAKTRPRQPHRRPKPRTRPKRPLPRPAPNPPTSIFTTKLSLKKGKKTSTKRGVPANWKTTGGAPTGP
jgi:superfamily I DNA/RNA helicase